MNQPWQCAALSAGVSAVRQLTRHRASHVCRALFGVAAALVVTACSDDSSETVGPDGIRAFASADLNDESITKVAVTAIEISGECPFGTGTMSDFRVPEDSPHFVGFTGEGIVRFDDAGTVTECLELDLIESGVHYPGVVLADGTPIIMRQIPTFSGRMEYFRVASDGGVSAIETEVNQVDLRSDSVFLGEDTGFVRLDGEHEREEFDFALFNLDDMTIIDTWRVYNEEVISVEVHDDSIDLLQVSGTRTPEPVVELLRFTVGPGANYEGVETVATMQWPWEHYSSVGELSDFALVGDEIWLAAAINSEEVGYWPTVIRYSLDGELIETLDLNFVGERWLAYHAMFLEVVPGGVLVGAAQQNSFGSGPCEDSDVRTSGCVRSFLLQLSVQGEVFAMAPVASSTLLRNRRFSVRRRDSYAIVGTSDGPARVEVLQEAAE